MSNHSDGGKINKMANDISNHVGRSIPSPRDGSYAPRKYEAEVVENHIPSDGNKIRFLITELVPQVNGHLRNNPVPLRRTYKDARGRTYTSRGTHNNNFTAEYWSTDTFRKTPPNVNRGERIYVWQKADSDDWWWEPVNHDSQSKRRLETVTQSVNADKPTGKNPNKHDAENTYYQEMSSQNKTWTVATSKANDEYAAYMIQINAGGGSIVLKDDLGNSIELNSKEKKIWIRNECQTEITCIENNIFINCNEQYDKKIGKDNNTNIGGNYNIVVNGNTKLECGNTEITGNVKIGGNVEIAGTLNVQGGTTMGGGGVAKGSMGIDGTLSVSGPVSLSGGTSSGVIKGSYIDT